jgi:hypothetical protein
VDVRQVRTEEDLASYAAVLRNAVGDQEWATIDFYLPRLSDPAMVLYLAYVDGEPAAAGRLEAPKDGLFAGLNDGGVICNIGARASSARLSLIAPPKPPGGERGTSSSTLGRRAGLLWSARAACDQASMEAQSAISQMIVNFGSVASCSRLAAEEPTCQRHEAKT